MRIKEFKTQKTARIGILEPEGTCKGTVLALHGYRQLMPYFAPQFEALQKAGYRIVAPEALNRFYIEGYSGRVGASWMTKEDRSNDIRDYLEYLESLCAELKEEFTDMQTMPLHLLGFSQGGATACRWLSHTAHRIDSLTLYASIFPNDFDFDGTAVRLHQTPSFIAFGDSDQFAGEEVIRDKMEWLNSKGVKPKLIRFTGGHELIDSVLLEIAREWDQINLC